MAIIDHLVVAATELETGTRWLEAHLGVRLSPGGAHHAMGTHNRLLKLGPQLFLEIIAIDPAAAKPARPRWFALESPQMQARLAQRPRLIHWVARSTDIVTESAACSEPLGLPMNMQRGNFEWLITVPDDGHLPGDGLAPTLIEWCVPQHPADGLPDAGCSLMKLEGFHPDPARIGTSLTGLGLDTALALHPTEPGDAPTLLAYLKTPLGLRELN